MSYIELHEHVWSHPKTIELSRILGISKTYSVAHLARLWTWCLRYADTGNISTFSSFQIADAADWQGDADMFLDALSKSGYVDDREGGIFIHDWDDYVGRLLRLRAIDKERKRMERGINKASDGCPPDVLPTGNGSPGASSGIADSLSPMSYPPIADNPKEKVFCDLPDECMKLFNSICTSLPNVKAMTDPRKTTLRAWGCTKEQAEEHFKRVQASWFLIGNNEKGWTADYDWIMKPANRQKIFEGKYDNKKVKSAMSGLEAF